MLLIFDTSMFIANTPTMTLYVTINIGSRWIKLYVAFSL